MKGLYSTERIYHTQSRLSTKQIAQTGKSNFAEYVSWKDNATLHWVILRTELGFPNARAGD